jgi:hypothetical protein
MIYITQLIFINEGQEAVFNEFEALAIPLIEKYNGKILYRIRPTEASYVIAETEMPYEIHLVSFASETDFQQFANDDTRLQFIHLKEKSVRSMLLIKGEAL